MRNSTRRTGTNGPEGVIIEDIPSEEERAYNLYPFKYFPKVGSLDDVVAAVPHEFRSDERNRWK